MSQEDAYMEPKYCLSCASKHSRDTEHHLEDYNVSARNNLELREVAQRLLEKAREIRRAVDDIRINELAKERLRNTL
jgi:queuine/archaeosine tRNA-ribosyltransferase